MLGNVLAASAISTSSNLVQTRFISKQGGLCGSAEKGENTHRLGKKIKNNAAKQNLFI